MSFKILLVDHDKASADRIGGVLRGAGHQLFTEIDTARALESFERMRPDVALVSDGMPGMPGAALCMRLKKTPTGSSTPVVFMTAKMPQGQQELSRRLEILGCDRIIDQRTSGEQLLEICRQVVRPRASVAAPKRTSGQAITQGLSRVGKDTNRDAASAISFDDALRSAFTDVGSPSDGTDIEAHLDSLFSTGHPVQSAPPPKPPGPAKAPSAAGTEAKAPVPTPAKRPPAAAPSSPAPPRPAATRSVQPTPPVARTPNVAKPAPAPPRPAVSPKPAEPVRPTARHAPKAVEQLRLPKLPEVPAGEVSSARRWLWPVVGLVGTVAVVGALAAGYLMFFRGDAESGEIPQIAESSAVEPPTPPRSPAPPIPEEAAVVGEALPEPPPLDESAGIDEVAQSGSVEADEPVPTRVARATPAPQPRQEPATAETAERGTPPASKGPAPGPAATAAAAAESRPGPTSDRPDDSSEPAPGRSASKPETKSAPESVPAKPSAEASAPQPTEAELPAAAEPVVVPPQVVNRVAPTYSAKALKGIDDPVIALRVLVDQQGKIARVVVEEGVPGSELEAAAISAVLRWTFRPATEDGVAVKAWTTVRFEFQE